MAAVGVGRALDEAVEHSQVDDQQRTEQSAPCAAQRCAEHHQPQRPSAAMALGTVRKATSGHSDERVTLPGTCRKWGNHVPPTSITTCRTTRQRGGMRGSTTSERHPPGPHPPSPPPSGSGLSPRRPGAARAVAPARPFDAPTGAAARATGTCGRPTCANSTATARSTSSRLRASRRWRLNSGQVEEDVAQGGEVAPGEHEAERQDAVPDPPRAGPRGGGGGAGPAARRDP